MWAWTLLLLGLGLVGGGIWIGVAWNESGALDDLAFLVAFFGGLGLVMGAACVWAAELERER